MGRPAHEEVTLVFTDLVGFSEWALRAGDDAMLRLLRWVAQVVEPPLLEAGGQVVTRMGDGIMAVLGRGRENSDAIRARPDAEPPAPEIPKDGGHPSHSFESLRSRLFQDSVQRHSGDTAVTREQIDTMLIHNPRTVFERHGS